MTLNRQQISHWIFAGMFFLLSLVLVGFHIFLSWFELADLERQLETEKLALESLKVQQSGILQPEIRELFERYSDGVSAVDILFAARDEVFTGQLSEDDYQPVMLLDYPEFFQLLQKLLGKRSVLSNLSIDVTGRISFLVQTSSYTNAARQMAVFRDGLEQERQRSVLAEEEEIPTEEGAVMPVLLTDLQISSVARNPITGKAEDVPEVLSQSDSSYDFIVQARINPEYYFFRREQELAAEELQADPADETDSSS